MVGASRAKRVRLPNLADRHHILGKPRVWRVAMIYNLASDMSSAETESKTWSHSPSARGRNSRIDGYQGQSARSSSQSQ